MTGLEAKFLNAGTSNHSLATDGEEGHDNVTALEFGASAAPRRRSPTPWIVSGIAVLAVLGYLTYARISVPAMAPPPQGPVPVEVRTMEIGSVRLWSDFSAHTRAVDQAEIRPEVTGRITEIRFQDGQAVKAGDILLVIDPRPFEAALAKAKADLVTAQTNAQFAATELGRADAMIKTQAIARRLYDQRVNENRTAAAAVQAAQANVTTAQLDVEHAYVRAPIAGRAGRAELTVGNVVQAGLAAPLLTTIVSTDGIYADFEVDEQTYMRTIHDNAAGKDQESRIPVRLSVGGNAANGDAGKTYDGTIYSFDNHIDPASGTIRARAKFSNEDGALVPGMFVSVRLADAKPVDAILVPERAINTDQDKKFVYVVSADNKVQYRPVKLGNPLNDSRVVLSGLQKGDRVIVSGLQHVRPDAPVTAKEAAPDTIPPGTENAPDVSAQTPAPAASTATPDSDSGK